jgi:carbonic anhydrase/acetyltransferase-like protein (isoleucine patch superfamily)
VTVRSFEGKVPVIGEGTWIHPTADVFGDVVVGRECWIGPGARIRGDYGTIVIGDRTSVEDNCVIHARPGEKTVIGDHVTLGHASIVHNAEIRDWAILGMGGIVSDWSTVGVWAVVAEGAVVRQGTEVPDSSIAVGVPARVIEKKVDDDYKSQWTRFKGIYVGLARRYREGLGDPIERF